MLADRRPPRHPYQRVAGHAMQRLFPLTASMLVAASISARSFAAEPCPRIPTFADGLTPTRVLHVAPNGSNNSGNGSAASPYATIAFAASLATPGTALVVHAGTYAGGGFVENLQGTAESPIWIGGAPGESRPVISGGSEGLHFVRGRYLVIHDLEIANAAANGLNFDDGGEYSNADAARFVIFRNLYIHDIGGGGNQDGLKLSGVHDFFVLDCEAARCGGASSGSGIDLVGCHDGVIARCYLHDLSANAVQVKGGSTDVTIRGCRMVETGERSVNIGGSTGFEFFRPPLSSTVPNWEARRIRVVSNVIVGANCSVAFVGCVDSTVANNTLVTPHNWIFRILQETTSAGGYSFLLCGDNRFHNNVVYCQRSDLSTYVNVGPNTAPGTFDIDHNLWYAYDNPAASTPTLPVPETAGMYGQNPLLANPGAGNYRIAAGSPAAGSGAAPAWVSADFLGTCYRDPPARGAFELPMPGDANCDGAIDFFDIDPFVAAIFDPAAYADANPGCALEHADVNGDANVNFFDIDGFLACLFDVHCP
jgi:hypothetical protein